MVMNYTYMFSNKHAIFKEIKKTDMQVQTNGVLMIIKL